MKGKTVLVTGANGLVGAHLVSELIDRGAKVICIGRAYDPDSYFFSSGISEKVVRLDVDITDQDRIFEIIPKYEIDTIFHLAAQPIVDVAFYDPLTTLKVNVAGTYTLLEAARQYGKVRAIVVASSDKAYGKSKTLPYTEDMPLNGDHPYEASKSAADLIARMYAKTYDLPITVTRFGNIYGPGDLNFNRIIPQAIKAGIFGETLDIRSDGSFIREYVYVKDVALAYLLLAEKIDQAKGEAFNISSGEKKTVLETVDAVSKAMNLTINTDILNQTKNEIPAQYLDSTKIQNALGWSAQYKLSEALIETISWYKKYFGDQS